MTKNRFKEIIWTHYQREGRSTLPWRKTTDPYAILVSEIMLQQTQVGRVEPYYRNFLDKFPDFKALANTSIPELLVTWQGLGYNRRALFLKRTAEIVMEKYNGVLPSDREALQSLPGIGKGTSGSLMAFAFNKPEIFIETNIRRVFIHFFFKNKEQVTDEDLERYIKSTIDIHDAREWYWALMDYGSAMKSADAVKKVLNPNRRSAHYIKQSAFVGSDRELRGKIVRFLLASKKMKKSILLDQLAVTVERSEKILTGLEKEGFIVRKGNYICINK